MTEYREKNKTFKQGKSLLAPLLKSLDTVIMLFERPKFYQNVRRGEVDLHRANLVIEVNFLKRQRTVEDIRTSKETQVIRQMIILGQEMFECINPHFIVLLQQRVKIH